jgi:hypothetical protein
MTTTEERLDAIEAELKATHFKVEEVLRFLHGMQPHIDKALGMLDSPAAKLAGMLRKR